MNVLCLGSEVVGPSLARELVGAFLGAHVHRRRAVPAALKRCTRSKGWIGMAKSRLHELSAAGVSVWIRHAGARTARDRRARADDGGGRRRRRHIQPDDLPEGARARATATTRSCARSRRTRSTPREIFFALAVQDIRAACDLLRPVWERPSGIDGYVSLEVDPTLAYDRERTFEQAIRFTELVDRPNCTSRSRRRSPGWPRSRTASPRGMLDQRHADLLARALRGGRRGLPPRARAARRGGRRSRPGALRRELLRLARRQRGRQAARSRRPHRPAGQARRRECEARLPALPRDLRRPALGVSRRQGRASAALPVGVDVDQEPLVSGHDLRVGADRPGCRQHDAARDDRGLPGSRRGHPRLAHFRA